MTQTTDQCEDDKQLQDQDKAGEFNEGEKGRGDKRGEVLIGGSGEGFQRH